MRLIIGIYVLLFSTSSWAESVIYAGLLKEDLNQSVVAEIGGKNYFSNYLFYSGSLMLFGHEDNIYEGINFSVNASLGADVKPYMGLGFFLGEYEQCEFDEGTRRERCESDYTGGLYPELGIQFSVYRFRAAIYSRYYKTFDAGNNEYNMIGLLIGLEI